MFGENMFCLIIFLFLNEIIHAHLSNVILSCETQQSLCGDATKVCEILCELPATVKFNDELEIQQVRISSDEIKSTKSSLSIKSVQMTNNLPDNIGNPLANFPSFQKFSVTHSKLKSVKPMNFAYMKLITELDLSHNEIEQIPHGVFDNLTQLETLSIHHNKIYYLPTFTLIMLTRLKEFNAQSNHITQIESDFFSNNKLIERIFLQNNKIVKINERFSQLSQLHEVDLRGNADFCTCKVIDQHESQRKRKECEKEQLSNESDWKKKFINCSMDKVLDMNTVTVGPCALNEVIRMVNADLTHENCIWPHKYDTKPPNEAAIENCTIERRNKEKEIWIEFEDCIAAQVKLHPELNQLLKTCYLYSNSRQIETSVTFNNCMKCTKMSDIRNIKKCELRYMKAYGDNINKFQDKVVSYFVNYVDS